MNHISNFFFFKMGCTESAAEDNIKYRNSRDITLSPRSKKRFKHKIPITKAEKQSPRIKIALIGPSSSGKTTFLRQLKINYLGGYDDVQYFVDNLKINIINCEKLLIDETKSKGNSFSNDINNLINQINELSEKPLKLTQKDAENILRISKHPNIQDIYGQLKYDDIMNNYEYLIKNVNRFSRTDFYPNELDIINCFCPSNSIFSIKFTLDNCITAELFDVAGTKSCRDQWDSVMDADIFVFVTALSDFDMVLKEDKTIDRMDDSFELFRMISNAEKPILLVLNKVDIFEMKLKEFPEKFLKTYSNFNGDINDVYDCIDHVKKRFLDQVKLGRNFKKNWIETIETIAIKKESAIQLFQIIANRILNNAFLQTLHDTREESLRQPGLLCGTLESEEMNQQSNLQQQDSPKNQLNEFSDNEEMIAQSGELDYMIHNQQKMNKKQMESSQESLKEKQKKNQSESFKIDESSKNEQKKQKTNENTQQKNSKKIMSAVNNMDDEVSVYEIASGYVTESSIYSEYYSSS